MGAPSAEYFRAHGTREVSETKQTARLFSVALAVCLNSSGRGQSRAVPSWTMETVREKIVRLVLAREKKKDELALIDLELDQLLPSDHATPSSEKQAPRPPNMKGQLHPGSLTSRILERINAEPTRLFTAADFKDMQNGSGMQTIRAGLLRLFKNDSIERPKWGRFKATKAAREAAKASTAAGGAS